jgi:RNA polymerase sigma factor (sigma-70 family)
VITRRTALEADLRKRCSAHRSALPDYGSEGWGLDSLPVRFRRSEGVYLPSDGGMKDAQGFCWPDPSRIASDILLLLAGTMQRLLRLGSYQERVNRIDETRRTDEARDFDAFFNQEYTPLLRLLFAVTGDRIEAEELAQEAMTRAFERWSRVSGMASPSGYVYRVAVNLNRSRLRHLRLRLVKQREIRHPLQAEPDVIGSVVAALAALPRGQREALLLVEWLGLDAPEAGRILGISASSVRSRVHRAKAVFQAEEGDERDV